MNENKVYFSKKVILRLSSHYIGGICLGNYALIHCSWKILICFVLRQFIIGIIIYFSPKKYWAHWFRKTKICTEVLKTIVLTNKYTISKLEK